MDNQYYYSPTTFGVYSSVFHRAAIPGDAVAMTKDQYKSWGRGGKRITVVDGVVEIIDGVLPKPSIADLWELIKADRDRRQLNGGVRVGDHWFLSNERAVSEYNTIVATTAGISATTVVRKDWRTMDGATVDMTPALALQILKTGIQQRCAIDDAALAHKAAMEHCAEPESYDYSTGWPDIYTPEMVG